MAKPPVPKGYRRLTEINWKKQRHRFKVVTLLAGMVLIIAVMYGIPGVDERIRSYGDSIPELIMPFVFYMVVMVGFVIMIALHEGVHYLAARAFRVKPTFLIRPFEGLFAIAMYDQTVTRNPGIVIAMAPFVLLTPALLIGALFAEGPILLMLVTMACMNASGSSMDLYMSWWMSRQHPSLISTLTRDLREYFFVKEDAPEPTVLLFGGEGQSKRSRGAGARKRKG